MSEIKGLPYDEAVIRVMIGNVEVSVDVPEHFKAWFDKLGAGVMGVTSDHPLSKGVQMVIKRASVNYESPPTRKMLSYALWIAGTVKMPLYAEARLKSSVCSEFIDHFADYHFEIQQIYTSYKLKVSDKYPYLRKVFKGAEVSNLLDGGLSLEQVAERFNVKRVATVQSYLDSFNEHPFGESELEDSMLVFMDEDINTPHIPYVWSVVREAIGKEPSYVDVIAYFRDRK